LQGVIPLAEYQRRRQACEQKQQGLAIQAKPLEAQVDRQGTLAEMVQSIEAFCQWVQTGLANATCVQKRTLVELLIARVLVANGDVEIRYAIPTHPRSETTRFCHLRQHYFHLIVPMFALPELTGPWERCLLPKGLADGRVRGVPVDGNHTGGPRLEGLEYLVEKALSRVGIARVTQHEIQRGTGGVHRPVEITPVLVDPDVRLIHTRRIVGGFQVRSVPLIHLWRIALHPAEHGGVID